MNKKTLSTGGGVVAVLLGIIGFQQYQLESQKTEVEWLWTQLRATDANAGKAAIRLGLPLASPDWTNPDAPSVITSPTTGPSR